MKYLVFLIFLFAACEKPSQYQCSCGVYGLHDGNYTNGKPFGKTELYYDKEKAAKSKCDVYTSEYNNAIKPVLDSLKATEPDAWASCGFSERDYGQL